MLNINAFARLSYLKHKQKHLLKNQPKYYPLKKMMSLLNKNGYGIGEENFHKKYLVKSNTFRKWWINSIFPDDVNLKRLVVPVSQ